MAKLKPITEEQMVLAVKEEGLKVPVLAEEPHYEDGTVGIAKTKAGRFLVYTVADGKLTKTSVHETQDLANGMLLRRLRAEKEGVLAAAVEG